MYSASICYITYLFLLCESYQSCMMEEEWDDDFLRQLEMIEAQHISAQNGKIPSHATPCTSDAQNRQETTQWACSKCTFLNAKTSSKCQVCGHSVPSLALKKTSQSTLPFNTQKASREVVLHSQGADPVATSKYYFTDEECKATLPIDTQALKTLVFPGNYQIREYQVSIAEKAMYHNTLVSLPTGLGKTLIASVVMHNFYRWFPNGKVIFLAPTKPLVTQQIQACYEINGLPLDQTAEIQGNVPKESRRKWWKQKRIFFCTPQSFTNDVKEGIFKDAHQIVCLIIDEAHRARGNYAYCMAIQELKRYTNWFRIVALSATPGSKVEFIQEIITNLQISHIEARTMDDSDVKKYMFERKEEIIKCPVSEEIKVIGNLIDRLLEKLLHRLAQYGVMQAGSPEKLTQFYLLQARDHFRNTKRSQYQSHQIHIIEGDFGLLLSWVHARKLLMVHGIKPCTGYIEVWRQDTKRISWSKRDLMESNEFKGLVEYLESMGSKEGLSQDHSKLDVLRKILEKHFTESKKETKAIVFTQFRASVDIIQDRLSKSESIRAERFIGQSSVTSSCFNTKLVENQRGQTQKHQQEIITNFKAGTINVLVATCIAEEGLDIGQVDLIVLYDTVTSPVRLIQRMGRTGRKRIGNVVILVTEGDEEKKLQRSLSNARGITKALTTKALKNKLEFAKCPRMLPESVTPQLVFSKMCVDTFDPSRVAGIFTKSRNTFLSDDNARASWRLTESQRMELARFQSPVFSEKPREFAFILWPKPRKMHSSTISKGSSMVVASKRSKAFMEIVKSIQKLDTTNFVAPMEKAASTEKLEDSQLDAPVMEEAIMETSFSPNSEAYSNHSSSMDHIPDSIQNSRNQLLAEVLERGDQKLRESEAKISEPRALEKNEAEGSEDHISIPKVSLPSCAMSSQSLSAESFVPGFTESLEAPVEQDTKAGLGSLHDDTSAMSPASSTKELETQKDDDDVTCSICCSLESHDGNLIVYCDGCDITVHQDCYGIQSLTEKWFCDVCRWNDCKKNPSVSCVLCPVREGAYKRTECGQWVHVQCFLWIPELQVRSVDASAFQLGSLDTFDPDRSELRCELCHSAKESGVIQCASPSCLSAFHVTCASLAEMYTLHQLSTPQASDANIEFVAYCPLHVQRQETLSPCSKGARDQILSPSMLLSTPSQKRRFRRLKRRRDAEFKGVGRFSSKCRRENVQLAAQLFVEEDVDVVDGSEEDEYRSDLSQISMESFINDSSQLVYSQSVALHRESHPRKSDDRMRAIYAQSIMESPELFKFDDSKSQRGIRAPRGKALRGLPANGVIRSCLKRLYKEQVDESQDDAPIVAKGKEYDSKIEPEYEITPPLDSSGMQETGTQGEEVEGTEDRYPNSGNKADAQAEIVLEGDQSAGALVTLHDKAENEISRAQATIQTDPDCVSKKPNFSEFTIFVSHRFTSLHKQLCESMRHESHLISKPLDADILLSLRVAVVCLELSQIALRFEQKRLQALVTLHQRLLVIFYIVDSSGFGSLDQNPFSILERTCEWNEVEALKQCDNLQVQLHHGIPEAIRSMMACVRNEAESGFPLSILVSDNLKNHVATAITDEEFRKRYHFFLSCHEISVNGAISLSFRFKSFKVERIPVEKFNTNHWRRMLPNLSLPAANAIVAHFCNK
uniref:DEAD/DEAH box RNA helicase putative n=1 Tax=Albugo laibachii Nc14 TaxID=890382 RepID=F0W8D7_9STRA|nr:DEAD/DEAH box RNA helicase putative [Albugo laibachii Nc14]CCA24367.1 DEAD/DEAH box RNA helicase putative [Albugo laibachii Nc14]|eukprot:CCA24367.1 DEAD/DEAH box RNA helicase putative [Albugo laibachii Nc14]